MAWPAHKVMYAELRHSERGACATCGEVKDVPDAAEESGGLVAVFDDDCMGEFIAEEPLLGPLSPKRIASRCNTRGHSKVDTAQRVEEDQGQRLRGGRGGHGMKRSSRTSTALPAIQQGGQHRAALD